MAQVDARPDHEQTTILRNILQVIAHTPDPRDSIDHIAKLACELTDAKAALFTLIDDPFIEVMIDVDKNPFSGHDDIVAEWLTSLGDGMHFNPALPADITLSTEYTLVAPLLIKNVAVGVLVLFYDHSPQFDDVVKDDVSALIDGLLIVTMDALSIAHHAKLGRNQSEFMRVVTHDLRSPLTSIQGFASMMESGMVGELNEKQTYFTEKILAGISQMASLVDNIQDAGRYDPETGFYEMERSPCDVTEIISKIVDHYLLPAEKQDLTIIKSIGDGVPIINADHNMLERAITNLVDNAIKYTPNGGDIEVSVDVVDDRLVISIRDTGLGISVENQKLLFERHVRIPRKEHKRVKGSGLGLFIVRSVARRHGGNAWVESIVDDGSTFKIDIPLNADNALI